MADLIELDVVVRNRGLKESLSTVSRLEREIIKATKALDNNAISQSRYEKVLLSAKRQYEALGVSSQKATAAVRKFADSQRQLTGSLGNSTKALRQHTEAQMAATKASNRMGVVTQQAGYQVSDFIVQVQSGTNPFVAFSQQASQLAGVLPLVASNIGLTTTAAIALSAALGIAIPLIGAIGAAYLVSRQRAKEAAEGTDTFAESLKDAQQASQDLRDELKLLASGYKDVSEAAFAEAVSQAEAAVDAAQKRLDNARGIAQKGARGNLRAAEEELRIAEEQLATYRQRRSFLEQESAFYDDILGSAEGLAAQEEALNEIFESRLGTIDDTANNYVDILGTAEGLAAQEQALNQLYESRLGTIDDTYNNYEDILGSAEGLAAQEKALNDLFEARLGTIDDTFNNYEDILGSEEGLQKSVDVLNQMYQDRLDKLQATADAYDDILGSEAGLLAAEEARLALTMVGDSGYAGGRGGDPREFAEAYFDALEQIKEQEEARAEAAEKASEKAKKAYEKAQKAAEKLRKELEGPMVTAVGTVSDAFGNFIARGLTDFKGFVKQILASFQNMIAQMIAMAVRNRIMLSLGIGGITPAAAAAGQVAGLGSASTMLGSIGTGTGFAGIAGGTGFLGGAANTLSGLAGGGAGFFNVAGNAALAGGGALATIGAALPIVGLGLALFSLFKKKPAISPENMAKVNQALKMTGQELDGTGREAQKAAAALGEVAGGFDKLTKKAQAFYEGFYTEGERRTIAINEATQVLNKTFAELEMAVPKTHAEFRQLVEAQDLMTEEGRETYNALLDISGAFVTLNGTMQQAAERAAILRQQELQLREARSLAQLQPFIGEEGAAATLERLSTQVYSGNIKSLVDGVFQEIFEALTPDGTQMGKISPYLEELTEQLEEIVEGLSVTENILRKYASGDITRSINKSIRRMSQEIRYIVSSGQGTPTGIAVSIFSSVRNAADQLTTIAKQTSRDLATLFSEFSVEFKVDNVLDESRKATDRINELLNAFTKTRDALQSAYSRAQRAFDRAPDFDFTTEAGREALEAAQDASRALGRASDEIQKLTLTIDTLRTSSRAFEQAVADKLVEPIQEALTVYLPSALDDLPQDIKNTMGGLFAGVTEGSLEGFRSAYVQLAELFANNKISVDQFNNSFKVMEDVFRGNISLTEEYTTKQQTVIEKLSNAYQDFTSKLENSISVVQSGIQSLIGQLIGGDTSTTRRSSISYLRSVARTGQYDAGRLEAAVGAATSVEAAGFGSRRDFIRYVADTTALLRTVEGTLSGQLETLEMQQVKAILNIQDTNQSAATSLQSIQSLIAEFLGVGGRIPTFATGGYHSGGLRIVGERGPELEATGPSRIIPAGQFSMGGDAELRREVAELRVDLKAALVQIAKNTRKSSDTLNKFDYQGLPDSRGY